MGVPVRQVDAVVGAHMDVVGFSRHALSPQPGVQKVAAKFTYVVAFCGSATFAYYSALLLQEAYVDELIDERGADMYQWILYFPMPIGSALLAIEFLRYLCGFDDMYDKRTDAIDARGSL